MTDAIKERVRNLQMVARKQAKAQAMVRVLGLHLLIHERSTEIEDASVSLGLYILREEYQKWVKHYEQLNREGKL